MTDTNAELLLHPIRLRIVLAMTGNEMTTAELRERLPDIAPATLYRQVATLARSGLLEVVAEEQKRGSVERTYRVVETAATIDAETASSMTKEEHLSAFITFAGAMIQAFGHYLDQPGADLGADGGGYRQTGLWVTPRERQEMIEGLRKVLARYAENTPTRGRSRISLSTILIPDGPTPGRTQ